MREILFRGFTPDEDGKDKAFVNGEWIKGQWVQGSYMKLSKTTYCFKEDYEANPDNTEHYIVFDQMTDWGLPNRHLQADILPETAGQYTGLTDKNNKRIFEGDIVVCSQAIQGNFIDEHVETGYVEMKHGAFGLHRKQGYYRPFKDWLEDYEYEVIGNIHDNPELLKGGAGK